VNGRRIAPGCRRPDYSKADPRPFNRCRRPIEMESTMHRVMRLLASALVVSGIAGFASAEEAPMEISGARTVTAEQIIPLINSTPELVIIDSRKAEDFDKGAIEKAIAETDTDMTPDV